MNPGRFSLCFDLFLTFAKVGICTFGGGYAMLPILQKEIVERRQWATDDDINDYFAIGQCTPGIIAVNAATFVGAKQAGIPGGIVATLGVIFPSIVFVSIVAAFLSFWMDIPAVQHAFNGIRACVCVLILNAVVKLARQSIINWPAAVIFASVFLISAVWGFSPVIIVIVCGILGLSIRKIQRNCQKHEETKP